jgi:hypothetical protein
VRKSVQRPMTVVDVDVDVDHVPVSFTLCSIKVTRSLKNNIYQISVLKS